MENMIGKHTSANKYTQENADCSSGLILLFQDIQELVENADCSSFKRRIKVKDD
jgi:hypothetical protein